MAAGSGKQAAVATTQPEGPTVPPTVFVRVAVDGAETLDANSLQLVVNEVPIPIPSNGLIELPLEIGDVAGDGGERLGGQGGPPLPVVVDLDVADHGRGVAGDDRLRAAGDVDERQPHVAEPGVPDAVHALSVWSAVLEPFEHGLAVVV